MEERGVAPKRFGLLRKVRDLPHIRRQSRVKRVLCDQSLLTGLFSLEKSDFASLDKGKPNMTKSSSFQYHFRYRVLASVR